ncbi:MAG: hypothetical protein ABS59_09955 [Methylobacterium sp. SCN 67-24]|jgi:hypothetical protein|nr:MAG: hypothetical protein ABS59_09955 [Methylobacterium sp. SCN 67-24]
MRPVIITIGGAQRAQSGRARLHSVRLYNSHAHPLFHWSGKARTSFEAAQLARETYSAVLDAVFRAQGMSGNDASPALEVSESEVLAGASPNAWRVTNRASHEAKAHRNAERVRLGKAFVSDIVTSVALTDRECITALQHDHGVALGMWLSATGRERLIDIDSCWIVTSPAGDVRVPHRSDVLRDMLRLLVLRGFSPYHETEGPLGRPFAGPRFEVHANSKTLLAYHKGRKPAPSVALVDWLGREGFEKAAETYRASFS